MLGAITVMDALDRGGTEIAAPQGHESSALTLTGIDSGVLTSIDPPHAV
jgi:hypothetical protein